jgi:hypothetical protein
VCCAQKFFLKVLVLREGEAKEGVTLKQERTKKSEKGPDIEIQVREEEKHIVTEVCDFEASSRISLSFPSMGPTPLGITGQS